MSGLLVPLALCLPLELVECYYEHLEAFYPRDARDDVLLCEVEGLYVPRDLPHDGLGLCRPRPEVVDLGEELGDEFLSLGHPVL